MNTKHRYNALCVLSAASLPGRLHIQASVVAQPPKRSNSFLVFANPVSSCPGSISFVFLLVHEFIHPWFWLRHSASYLHACSSASPDCLLAGPAAFRPRFGLENSPKKHLSARAVRSVWLTVILDRFLPALCFGERLR